MPFQRTAGDSRYIDSLPNKVIAEFRSSIYTPTSVEAHSRDYITTDWIDAAQLRQFVDNGCHHRGSAFSPPKSTPTPAKVENNAPDAFATRCVDCAGAYVCERADRQLPEVERRDLDIRDFAVATGGYW
ncbi:hypothetical protein R3P38DRAFT_3184909 [Favolaschia claudopus]|uniref:Uncharacterized protein n=1 Tax=Favolaschia claudopus TaxID=2862362 RepID=A0AAW0C6S7_9AGAR